MLCPQPPELLPWMPTAPLTRRCPAQPPSTQQRPASARATRSARAPFIPCLLAKLQASPAVRDDTTTSARLRPKLHHQANPPPDPARAGNRPMRSHSRRGQRARSGARRARRSVPLRAQRKSACPGRAAAEGEHRVTMATVAMAKRAFGALFSDRSTEARAVPASLRGRRSLLEPCPPGPVRNAPVRQSWVATVSSSNDCGAVPRDGCRLALTAVGSAAGPPPLVARMQEEMP